MCVPSVVRRFLLLRGLLSAAPLIAVLLIIAAPLPPAYADDGDVEITAALINAGQGRSDASHEWVLLTNLGDDAVDLSGWTLADNASSDPLGDAALAPRASLLIAAACAALSGAPAADADLVLADAAIGRGLGNRGDLLELRNAAGGLIDAVSWGNVDTHGQRSAPDAGEPLRFGDAAVPLPRSEGDPILLSLQIADAEDGSGVIELANACEWQQPLDGWSITVGSQRTDLAGLSAPPNGTVAAPIELPSAAARIALRSPDGQVIDVIDAADWPPVDSADAQAGEEGTATTTAQAASDAPALTIRSTIRITEFMPRPLPDQPEWVELINDGAERVDLSGWRIGDAGSSRELWGAIEPGQRVVFAAGQLPAGGGEIRLLGGRIGNGLNNDGDTLRLIAPDGAVAVSVEYGGPELPVPAAGASLALTPRVWVVNSTPSPGGAAVAPALEAAAPALQPIERSPAPPAPIGELQASEGINPWMVVSAGLGGLLVALLLRRWLPNQAEPEEPPLGEPPPYHLDLPEHQIADYEPPPEDLGEAPTRTHPWTEDSEDTEEQQ